MKIKGYQVVEGEFIDTENFYMHHPAGKITEIEGVKIKFKCEQCKKYVPEEENTGIQTSLCEQCLVSSYKKVMLEER
jgi:Zn finger protein HypA/HybF involved in hydrogenase expression